MTPGRTAPGSITRRERCGSAAACIRQHSLPASAAMFSRLIWIGLFPGLPALARAEESAADKSHYSLFSPTPAAQMRAFDTDRPDKTNSAHTVPGIG